MDLFTQEDADTIKDLANTYKVVKNPEYEIRFSKFITDYASYKKFTEGWTKREVSVTAQNGAKSAGISGVVRYEKKFLGKKDLFTESFIVKKTIGSFVAQWLGLKISLATEEPVEEPDEAFTHFRYRDRVMREQGNWRYDVTRVRTLELSDGSVKDWFNECIALPADAEWECKYEFEVEWIGTKGPTYEETVARVTQLYAEFGEDLVKLCIDHIVYPSIMKFLPNARNFRALLSKPIPLTRARLPLLTSEPYSVTFKADGEREYLWFDTVGMYALRAGGVTLVKKYPRDMCALIDCESMGDDKYVFDVLVWNSRSVTEYTYEDRFAMIDEVIRSLPKTGFNLTVKDTGNAQKPEDIYQLTKTLVEKPSKFEIDGLIFTPLKSVYYNKTTFKWKFPEKNSIDFLVKKVDDTLELFVGASLETYTRVMRLSYFNVALFPNLGQKAVYGPMPFRIGSGPAGLNKVPVSEAPDVEDDTIWEFVYLDGKWKPLHFRPDRTAEYKRQLTYGNNYDAALDVWETIVKPIPLESLTTPAAAETYWASTQQVRTGIRGFSNFVKGYLYGMFVQKQSSLLEVAGGHGNDLPRWISSGVANVTVLDIDRDAIAEMNNRFVAQKRKNPDLRLTVEGFVCDVTKDCSSVLVGRQYDTISCMFAVHYFCQSQETFMKFLDLAAIHIKPRGYLMITSFSGSRVFAMLNEEIKTFNKTDGERLAYIKVKYTESTLKPFGQKIGVWVSTIGQEHDEYLVNYEALIPLINKTKKWTVAEKKPFITQMGNYPDRSSLERDEIEYMGLMDYLVLKKK